MIFEKKWQKVNWQKLIDFEGFSKNGYHHVFQRIFFTQIALDEIDFGDIFGKS